MNGPRTLESVSSRVVVLEPDVGAPPWEQLVARFAHEEALLVGVDRAVEHIDHRVRLGVVAQGLFLREGDREPVVHDVAGGPRDDEGLHVVDPVLGRARIQGDEALDGFATPVGDDLRCVERLEAGRRPEEDVAVGVGEQERECTGRGPFGEDLQLEAGRPGGRRHGLLFDLCDGLRLAEVVARAVVRGGVVDRVHHRVQREHGEEQRAGEQVLQRHRVLRQVDDVDDHERDDAGDRQAVVGLVEHRRQGRQHEPVHQCQQDDLDDQTAARPVPRSRRGPGDRSPPALGHRLGGRRHHPAAMASRIDVAASVKEVAGSLPVKISVYASFQVSHTFDIAGMTGCG